MHIKGLIGSSWRVPEAVYLGASYKAHDEAGKFGFWIQKQMTALSIKYLAVNPVDIPKSQKDSS